MNGGDNIELYKSEITIINKNHRLYSFCDDICFKSKNLYNYANYLMRQKYAKDKIVYTQNELNFMLKEHETFLQMSAKTSQLTLLNLCKNWKSFFVSIKDYHKNKSKYCGMPKLPKYLDKQGRHLAQFDYMQGLFKNEKYYFPYRKTGSKRIYKDYIESNLTKENFVICRIIPYGNCYKIEMVYKYEIGNKTEFNTNYLAIDLGIDNFATLTNNIGLQPIVINGKILKSINNYYNKLLAEARSYIGNGSSNRIKRINTKRNNIVNTHFHKISKFIINYCIKNGIENIIIGRNKDWQRDINLGNKNNQKFANIPYEKLIFQLKYKGLDNGINVEVIDEKYTSKSSFIDNDIIPDKFGDYEFSGKRIKRGLYESEEGLLINADVNGSYNILRKCNSEFKYNDRIKGVSLHPVRLNIT